MSRLCANCGMEAVVHVDGKCLFEPTNFAPGKMTISRKTVKAAVAPKQPKKA